MLSLCTGEYIALADQDDIWFPEKIAMLLDNIGNHLLIHSDAILIDAEKNKIADSFTRFSNAWDKSSQQRQYRVQMR